ncbi:MAG: hypothetical protein C0599_12170 [Salinivirgaceae bacterium]|nr:MAG: hypothetical protein C0599_12170 [Salinivirgaceae bacterium]
MHIKLGKHIVFTLITLVIMSSCVTTDNYKYWSFFFDGVPDPSVSDNKDDQDVDSVAQVLVVDNTNKKPSIVKHVPFAEDACNSCHDQNNMGGYVAKQPDLCYQCHDDFGEAKEYLHGPVQGGYCSNCHQPHKSKHEKLLVMESDALCLECHEQSNIESVDFHADLESFGCTDCHDPHGGSSRKFMAIGSCVNCHGSFADEYKFVHGPVAAGYCNTCHSVHSGGEGVALRRQGQQLCLYCHDKGQVMKNENHEGIEDFACTECHNPHGGEDRFILN